MLKEQLSDLRIENEAIREKVGKDHCDGCGKHWVICPSGGRWDGRPSLKSSGYRCSDCAKRLGRP